MRLDLFLKTSRLIRRRTFTKKACDAGLVKVDGQNAKPARKIREGQIISIQTPTRLLEVKVVRIPKGNVPKGDAVSLYQIIRDEYQR